MINYMWSNAIIHIILRRNASDTDTASTSDDCIVGGLGKYSHASIGLSHQHWVEQVISAGSFGVHCTEAAEAYHKTCMRLASRRVKHLRPNLTQQSMIEYQRRFNLFETLARKRPCVLQEKVQSKPPPVSSDFTSTTMCRSVRCVILLLQTWDPIHDCVWSSSHLYYDDMYKFVWSYA